MKKILVTLFILIILGAIGACATIYVVYLNVKDELPPVETLKDVEFQTPMQVYSADGKLISQFGEKRRIPLSYQDIPKSLIDTLLATEDARFFSHNGVDVIGIFRAAFTVLLSGEKKQGASTITMQVARGFFLTRDKTYIRKIKEIFIALHMEQVLSKEEILTLYINKVELGYRAFGFGAAAQVYYGKPLAELSIEQMAMLTGLLKAPTAYNPLRNPERALFRRNTVLWRLKDTGVINDKEYQVAIKTPLSAKYHGAQIELDSPYVAEMARQKLVELYGEELAYTKGFQVYTTINAKAQNAATQALRNNLHNYDERHGYRGPVKQLWQANETPWQTEKILDMLSAYEDYGLVQRAVVLTTDTEKNQFTAITRDGATVSIDWDGMKWARKYIHDEAQGPAPKTVADILQPGALVSIRKNDGYWQLTQLPDASAALVALNPNDGSIIALTGGYDFHQSEFNRVTQAKRQVGSNIKPLIYSAALEHGFTLASIVNDAPINQWDRSQGTVWRPRNSPAIYDGPIRVRKALAKSKNVVSVRLLRAVGLNNIIEHLAKFGINPHDLPRNESLALGSASLTPIEMATAYTVFTNGGYLVEPYVVDRILTPDGEQVYKATVKVACDDCAALEQVNAQQAPRAISAQNAFLVADAMQSTIWGGGNWGKGTGWNGTGWRAQALKRQDIGGKTGTTNEAKDTWFSGYGPDVVVTSWVGFDDHSRALGATSANPNLPSDQVYGREFGAQTALPAWIDFLDDYLADKPQQNLHMPDGVVTVRIDSETGQLSRRNDHTSLFEYFVKGTSPTTYQESGDRFSQQNGRSLSTSDEDNLQEIF
nr:penicillin-binding protein 1A [Gayadomonas joobiniege]